MNSKDIYCAINLRHLTVKQISSIEREGESERRIKREMDSDRELYILPAKHC